MANQRSSSLWQRPSTRLGWGAVGFGAVFLVMFIIKSTMFKFMILCGLAAGIIGLIVIIEEHERSWLIWLNLLPGVYGAMFGLMRIPVPVILILIVVTATNMEYRKKTVKFIHYFMHGVASGIIGVILKTRYQNLHTFPDLGLPGFFMYIPIILLIAALIGAGIGQWIAGSKTRFISRFLAFVFANATSFSLCFFGFQYHFSIT